jgi:hypothetical protein
MTRSRAVGAALFILLSTIFGIATPACEDTTPPVPCREIPIGGCPADGNACSDPSCYNLFDCVAGEWQFVQACPTPDAAPPSDASDAHASLMFDANGIDAPPGSSGGPGCADLEPPDCPLALAIACANTDCCGCTDLYVCQNGGWNVWGTCGDGGIAQM